MCKKWLFLQGVTVVVVVVVTVVVVNIVVTVFTVVNKLLHYGCRSISKSKYQSLNFRLRKSKSKFQSCNM